MKTVLILLCSALGAAAQSSNLTWRLQVEAISTNTAAANALRGQVQSIIKPQDIADPDNKTSPVEVRLNEPEGFHRVIAVYILKDEATATNALAQLAALKNPNLAGRLVLHCCPREGAFKDWSGCNSDARAKFREVLW